MEQKSCIANQIVRCGCFCDLYTSYSSVTASGKNLDDHIGLSRPFALASLAILVSEPQKNITVLRNQTTSFHKAGKVGFTNIVSKSR